MNAPGSFPVRCHNPVAADIDVTDNCFCTVFFAGLYLSSSFNKTAIIFYKNNEVFVNCDMYLQSRRFASPHRAGNAGCPTRSIRQAPSSFREKWHLLERSNNLAPPSPLPRIFISKADLKAGDALYEANDWVAFGRSFQQPLQ